MAKKYYWTRKEEIKLRELWKSGVTDFEVLAKELERKPLGVKKKLQRMGVVVSTRKIQRTTTTVPLSKDLLTHEQALKILTGALQLLQQPGQDKLELQRLRTLVMALQTYDSVLEKFEKWIEIEERLLEMGKKIEKLARAQKVSSRSPRA